MFSFFYLSFSPFPYLVNFIFNTRFVFFFFSLLLTRIPFSFAHFSPLLTLPFLLLHFRFFSYFFLFRPQPSLSYLNSLHFPPFPPLQAPSPWFPLLIFLLRFPQPLPLYYYPRSPSLYSPFSILPHISFSHIPPFSFAFSPLFPSLIFILFPLPPRPRPPHVLPPGVGAVWAWLA